MTIPGSLENAKVLISKQPFTNDSLAQARSKVFFEGNLRSDAYQSVNVKGIGRYVRIQQKFVNDYLAVSEVKIIAER